jgi:hypothetical protein
MPTAAASRYDHDPRVAHNADHTRFTVTAHDGTTYHVHTELGTGWGIFTAPFHSPLPVAGGGYATGNDTADHAIAALIGDPA